MASFTNSLHNCARSNAVCKALGIKITNNAQVVMFAKNAGFESLFIDLEHGWFSLADASNLCMAGLLSGVTPFVRVPHQCGNGFVQRVLDGGASGVVFPHIHNARDAEAAVAICKYPPVGCRSMTGTQAAFNMKSLPSDQTVELANSSASSVIAMIESKDAIERIDDIAAVKGVDCLLVGSSDLTMDLGIPGDFTSPVYRAAMEAVSKACREHGQVFGVGGVYGNSDLQEWLVNGLGARFMLVQQDTSLLASAASAAAKAVPLVKP